jgi:acetyl-CoA decarbonylase/synthase complex subunit gamma
MAMSEKKKRKGIRELSPVDVYRLLPDTSCGECGEANCMAFAARVVNGETVLSACLPLYRPGGGEMLSRLEALLAPPVRTVTFGNGKRTTVIGGKQVQYRHEFAYHNPTAVVIDVDDSLPQEDLVRRVRRIESFSYSYIGRELTLDAIAVRSVTGDPARFSDCVRTVADTGDLPLVLCSLEPDVMESGIRAVPGTRPLLYAATRENWERMACLAEKYSCPLVVSAPGDLALLGSLSRTMREWGLQDLVLDPGTGYEHHLSRTLDAFSCIRREVFRDGDEVFGFPLLGTPLSVHCGQELSRERSEWKEAYTASMLMTRYADILIMHSLSGWVLLPSLVWRFNLYTDPRKPVSVEPGIRVYGTPDTSSPVLVTTNYALTFFTVESDIKSGHLDCYLMVIDTGGLSVESAVAGKHLTPDRIASAIAEYHPENLVRHRTLVIPGLAARISGETEELTGWRVLVGPKDSSGIPQFVHGTWEQPDGQA